MQKYKQDRIFHNLEIKGDKRAKEKKLTKVLNRESFKFNSLSCLYWIKFIYSQLTHTINKYGYNIIIRVDVSGQAQKNCINYIR